MTALSTGYSEVNFNVDLNTGISSNETKKTIGSRGRLIMGISESILSIERWKVEESFHASAMKVRDTTKLKAYYQNFKYYPVLSYMMLVPFLMSLTLLLAYWVFEAITIYPGVLLWSTVGFGGMYVVLISASKEIYYAEKKHKA